MKYWGISFVEGILLGIFPWVAHAQNSVTLNGIVDVGVVFTSNAEGARQYAMTSGVASGSRFGFRGSEDLGDGLKTIFVLENGFAPTTGKLGQNGDLFGRQAYVGLMGNWGTVTLGRTHSNTYDLVSPLASGPTWAAAGAGFGTHPADLDNLNTTNRINNALKYMSPDYHGLTWGAMYSLGGVAGDFTKNQIVSLAAAYSHGPMTFAVGYLDVKNPNFSFWGDKANDSTNGSNITSPVIAGFASANSQLALVAATSYVMAATTVGLVYSKTRFSNLGAVSVAGLTAAETAYRGSVGFDSGEINVKYQVNPSLLLAAAYNYTHGGEVSRSDGARYRQINLGADYLISKRTDVYAVTVLQRAAGTNSTDHAAVAAINGATPSSTNKQVVSTIGIRHRF
ncbi:porin [Caballeronia sordidicola]|uniref:Outer membrane protein (Porin) n=1 Tax=Caballeronia sordidicola TaxID=196367 RepID=A0A242M9U1_CABSO|nr:porin [Caballeronia sordidicola]OTP67672.1 Outer membrane protein (porin) [Caballeronia sordidicola]